MSCLPLRIPQDEMLYSRSQMLMKGRQYRYSPSPVLRAHTGTGMVGKSFEEVTGKRKEL